MNVRVPPATVNALDALAERRGVRRSDLVRDAVDRLLAEEAVATTAAS
jgi:metal-responsive CopG/Arc/MetJ family transcriptional regulator